METEKTILTKEQVFAYLPSRSPNANKSTFGKVLAICGSTQYRGAALLSVLGAMRMGAGLVTLAAPECVLQTIGSEIAEAVFYPLEQPNLPKTLIEKSSVCLFGCGLVPNEDTFHLFEQLMQTIQSPIILDAGALRLFAGKTNLLARLAEHVPVIITPHAGEMAHLCSCEVEDVERERASCAVDFARSTGVITVLKGHETLIACPDGILYENHTGNQGLARGGSGDLLAGMIAGLVAQGMAPADAAAAGVFLHGLAADECAKRLSMRGMLPRDILTDLCTLLKKEET